MVKITIQSAKTKANAIFQYCQKYSQVITLLFAGCIGAAVFIHIYGIRIISPVYTDWLCDVGGDTTQHYLGWMAFRNGDWTFPIGLTDQLIYPDSASVMFTDSIPLLAIFFKLLSPILPETFQYFGLWCCITYVLNGVVSGKILQRFCSNPLQVLLGSSFFILSFPVRHRIIGHEALAGQWVILLAILLFVWQRELSHRKKLVFWGLFGFLTPAIHVYYLPMCGIILLGACLTEIIANPSKNRKQHFLSCLFYIAVYCSAAWIMLYLLGAFHDGVTFASYGLGLYSFNLNGFWNNQGMGDVFPQLETANPYQYEGFSYIGAGIILLLVFDIPILILTPLKQLKAALLQRKSILVGTILIFLCSIVIAASPVVTFGSKTLFTYSLPDWLQSIWSIFRASGRFAWIGMYLMMLASIILTRLIRKPYVRSILLVAALALQVDDISNLLRPSQRFAEPISYENPCDTETLDSIIEAQQIQHFVFVDPWDLATLDYYPFSVYAMEHHITLNEFNFARVNAPTASVSVPQFDTLYIWRAETADYSNTALEYYTIDAFVVGAVPSHLHQN